MDWPPFCTAIPAFFHAFLIVKRCLACFNFSRPVPDKLRRSALMQGPAAGRCSFWTRENALGANLFDQSGAQEYVWMVLKEFCARHYAAGDLPGIWAGTRYSAIHHFRRGDW